tara:strand:+ start:26 stop:517 length:492 start_codon:yes stop_codon:yes gene_type:complete
LIDLKEISNKIFTKNNLYCLCVILIIFFLDRYTKLLILNNFNENSYYLNDFLNLDLIWNIGIGFGFLSTESGLLYNFITFVIAVILLVLFYFLLSSEILDKIIYAVIIGGALGNFYDRLFFKAVPDFIDLHYNNFHWFTFNVADIFISIGILFIIVKSFFVKN